MKYKIYISFLLGCFFYYTGYGQAPDWKVNAEDYRYSMSLIATGAGNCFAPMSKTDMIGVFDQSGICRGKSNLISIGSEYRVIMTIYGNALTDTLSYRIYDASVNRIVLSADTLLFMPEEIMGTVSSPEIIKATDCEQPSVTINQGSNQADPTTDGSIVFDVVFSEPVTGFDGNDVTIGGTAGATTATVSGSGTTYTVTVTGMTGSGPVTALIAEGAAMNGVGKSSGISTSTDNEVMYEEDGTSELDNTAPILTAFARKTPSTSATNSDILVFDLIFSEKVSDVTADDFTITGTTAIGVIGASLSDSIYTLTISGGDLANLNGIVGLNVASGQDIQDLAGNALGAEEPAIDEIYEVDNMDSMPLIDKDEDGLTDEEETTGTDDVRTPANPNGYTSDPTKSDTDGDGLNDGEEAFNATNPNKSDSDGDGLNDKEEITGEDNLSTGAVQPTGMPSNPNNICDPLQLDPSCNNDNNACVNITAHVWLEGTYSNNAMYRTLNKLGYLPGQRPLIHYGKETAAGQPYNRAPWNYTGTEGKEMDYATVGDPKAGYGVSVVDWVLVSLRSGTDRATTVCTRAALLHEDGHIEFVSGSDCCELNVAASYYLVIEHRNHLIVMSPQRIPVVNGTITYDFRKQDSYKNTSGVGQVHLGGGVYAMFGANGNQTSENQGNRILNINDSDNIFWSNENGQHSSYYMNDFDLNGDVNIQDKNIWLDNNGKFSDIKWENGDIEFK